LQIAVFGKNGPDLLTTIAAAVFLAVTVGEGSVEEGTRRPSFLTSTSTRPRCEPTVANTRSRSSGDPASARMGCTAPSLRSVNAGVSTAFRPVAKTSSPSEGEASGDGLSNAAVSADHHDDFV